MNYSSRMWLIMLLSLIFISIIVVVSYVFFPDKSIEKSIVIITPSYNNKDWYVYNLNSIFSQNYTNYRLIYIDDCSNDGTYEVVKNYIDEKRQWRRITLVKNKTRQGALSNIYYAIHSCDNKEIVILLDGDDWFFNANVLKKINETYTDADVWMTYGQFFSYPANKIGFCKQVPQHIIENNLFRESEWTVSHLRTFYAWLFKQIKRKDLLYRGNFFSVAWDRALMYPMLEMAGNHARFIPDILHVYNHANQLNDDKLSPFLCMKYTQIIQERKKYLRLKKSMA